MKHDYLETPGRGNPHVVYRDLGIALGHLEIVKEKLYLIKSRLITEVAIESIQKIKDALEEILENLSNFRDEVNKHALEDKAI